MAVLDGRIPSALQLGHWPRWALAVGVGLLGLATLGLAVDGYFAQRALPGVTVGDVGVGSLTAAEVRQRLAAQAVPTWSGATVTATAEGRTWSATNGVLGITPDLEAAGGAAVAYGKAGSLTDRLLAWPTALSGGARIGFVMRASGTALEQWVDEIAAAVARPVVEAEIRATDTGLSITDPTIGREIDRAATIAALLAPPQLTDRELALPMRWTYPAVEPTEFAVVAARARAVTTPVEVIAGEAKHAQEAADLAALLEIERAIAPAESLPPLPAGTIAPPTRHRYEVRLSEERVRAWVIAVAGALDRPARNATYTVGAGGALNVVPAQEGVRIDQEALLALALRELVAPSDVSRRTLTVAYVAEQPVFTTEQARQFASGMVRIGSYTTYFPYSPSRHANIATGAAQFNNRVIAPGETFSFWRLIGPVTVERGYRYAGAIINGRSDDSVIGGGLCQVSTTLFNVVARAGYQIVERGSHEYYIDRYPLGLDAAVFLPGLDLRWRNDTNYPVLIRSGSTATSVTFELFSIPSGRSVAFSAPLERNFRDVRPDQPADPAFPRGVKVLGRDVWVTRTVTQGGRVLHTDTFFSRYIPVWGGPLP